MIHVRRDSGELMIKLTEESTENFKHLINKGLNTWDYAPAELKELGDMLTHGRVTQDHTFKKAGQEPVVSGKYSETPWDSIPICSHCNQKGEAHMFNCVILTGVKDSSD